eukprot:jgi/Tetstr1/464991/TSEL_009722.t1
MKSSVRHNPRIRPTTARTLPVSVSSTTVIATVADVTAECPMGRASWDSRADGVARLRFPGDDGALPRLPALFADLRLFHDRWTHNPGLASPAHVRHQMVVVVVVAVAASAYWSTHHRMDLCATLACCLAALHPALHRQPAVDMLCVAIHPSGPVQCRDDPPMWFRTKLVEAVLFLRAQEAVAPVRKAFAAGVVDGLLWGGYTGFMRRMGLPVYLEADKWAATISAGTLARGETAQTWMKKRNLTDKELASCNLPVGQ